MTEWQKAPFTEVIDFQEGPGILAKDFRDSGVPLVRLSGLDDGASVLDGCNYLDPDMVARKWAHFALAEGDILLSTSASLGRVVTVQSEAAGAIAYTGIMRMRPRDKRIFAPFIRYLLASPEFQQQAVAAGAGSVLKHFGPMHLQHMHVHFPCVAKQQKITSVLSSLDAKIDLNNRICRELESLAKTIYDYWFVQFDFPDAKGRPYKTSGGKMVWNETLKREIPAGWGESDISAAAEVAGGATPSKAIPSYWHGNIPFFTPTDASGSVFQLTTEDSITQSALDSCSSELFEKGTVFITARGSVGRLAIAGCAMAMNQSCYALKPKTPSTYPYVFLHAKTLIHYLKVKASGSTFNSIVTNDIEWTRLVSPEPGAIAEFCKTVRPMFDRIEAAHRENLELSQLRDWLLPLLMNGQVKPADL